MGQWQLQTLALLAACAHGPSQLAEARLHALYPLRHLLGAPRRRRRGRSRRRCSRRSTRIECSSAARPGCTFSTASSPPSPRSMPSRGRLSNLHAAHGTRYRARRAVLRVVVDGGAGGAGPPVGADGALVGTAMDVLAKCPCPGADVPAAPTSAAASSARPRVAQLLSTPRRSPFAVRAAADGGSGASAPAAACDRSSQRLLVPTEVGSSRRHPSRRRRRRDAVGQRSVRRSCVSWAISRRRPRESPSASTRCACCWGCSTRRRAAPGTLRRRLEGGRSFLSLRHRRRRGAAVALRRRLRSRVPLLTTDADAGARTGTAGTRRRRVCSPVPGGVVLLRIGPDDCRPSLGHCATSWRNPCSPQALEATAAASRWTRRRQRRWRWGTATLRLVCAVRRRRRRRAGIARPPFMQELLRSSRTPPNSRSARRPRAAPAAAAAAAPRPAARRPRCPRQTRARRSPRSSGPRAATQALLSAHRRHASRYSLPMTRPGRGDIEALSRRRRAAAVVVVRGRCSSRYCLPAAGSPQAAAADALGAIDGSVLRQRLVAAHAGLAERARRSGVCGGRCRTPAR